MASLKANENHHHQPIKGLQLNLNKLNTIISTSDENAQQQAQQQPNYLLPLKPALLNPQPQQQQQPKSLANFDENYGLFSLKPVAPNGQEPAGKGADSGKCGRESPKEPSPPKLKWDTRNVLKAQPLAQQQPASKQQQPLFVNKENPTLQPQIINLKQPQVQQPPPQESIISRIPRLSLKFPLTLLNNNANQLNQQQQLRDVKQAKSSNSHKLNDRLAPVHELKATSAEPIRFNLHQAAAAFELDAEPEEEEEEEEIEDIDKSTSRDAIFLVCDIAKDIYDYMYQLEEQQSIKQDHLKDQKIFTPKVRQRLTNWCIEIHLQLKLLPETLYLTIAVIDRFMDRVQVKQQSQVQLVAVGATLIASKYEEIYPPDVGDLMHLTQNSYTRREIMRVEIQILEQLNFDLGKPIPLAFLRRFSKAAHCDNKMHSIAKYLMELSLSEYECSHWRPSMLAAAALFTTIQLTSQASQVSPTPASFGSITRRAVVSASKQNQNQQQQRQLWTRSLIHHTRYESKQLQEPAAILCKVLKRSQKNPQSYACVKKNMPNLVKWPELKSAKVDELIKLGGHQV